MIFMSAIIMSCGNRTQLYNVEGLLSDTARYIIDLDHVEKEYIINMSSYFDSMEIIPLETRKDVLLGRISKIQEIDNHLFVLDKSISKSVLVFDKKGAFLFRIGKLGQGPGEYTSISDFSIDPTNRIIYLLDNRLYSVHKYALDNGKYLNSIRLSGMEVRRFHLAVLDSCLYTDAFYLSNISDSQKQLLRMLNMSKGEEVTWMNYKDYNWGWDKIHFVSDVFYDQLDGKDVKFVQPFMNMVMELTLKGVKPYICLKSKNWLSKEELEKTEGEPAERYNSLRRISRIYNINSFMEFDDYIFLKYEEGGIANYLFYDKNTSTFRHTDFLANDLLYNTSDYHGVDLNICFADSAGIYGSIHPFAMERFIKEKNEGRFKEKINSLKCLEQLNNESNPIIFYLKRKRTKML